VRAAPKQRRVTWRVVVFALALVLVLGTAAGAVAWYARSTYYVGIDGGRVAIFKGRPGGMLWFDPTLEARTNVPVDQVLASRRPDLESGREFTSKSAAQRYVENLREEARTTATTTTIPTTTIPAPPTTLPAAPPTGP
jgi:hypothetical protein